MNAVIYCYTNLINGKKYIGQTIDQKQRFNAHHSAVNNPKNREYNSHLHRAMRKYGEENFQYSILARDIDNYELLNLLEQIYIKKFNTQIPNGYNIELGGKNCSKSPKTEEEKYKLTWDQAKLTEQEVIELRLAYQRGESPRKIYNEKYLGRLHYNAFLNIWSGRRYKNIMPEVIKTGRHTKLTEEIVKQIRQDREEMNLSYDKLATKYNISKATIADIIKRRTWKSV